jgi:nucleotide-binding universal stress UspA family protein
MTDGLVLCGVDGTEAGTAVMTAAKATGAPVLLVHIANDLWGKKVPAFVEDTETERLVDHGPVGPRLLRLAEANDAGMIVLGTRARRWPSVARHVTAHATCPVMIVGPAADPEAEAVTRPAFDRALLRRSPVPVVVLPRS